MTINERIRILRKDYLKNTLVDFGKKLGVGKTAISSIETGTNNVSDQMFKSIVREFGVNPEWLKDGVGEPFKEMTRNKRIEDFVKDILTNEPEGRKARLIDALASLDADGWDTLYNIASHFVEGQKAQTDADPDVTGANVGNMTDTDQPEDVERPSMFSRQDDTLLPFA